MNIWIKCVIMLNACNVLRHFFCHLWSKTKSAPDQMDVMWAWSMSWRCSVITIKPRHSRPSETCPPLKEIPDEGVRRRRKKSFLTPNNLLFRHLWSNAESAPDQMYMMWVWDMSWYICKGRWRCSEVTVTIGFVPEVTTCNLPFGGYQTTSTKIHYFFVISDTKVSPLQIR